jgi:transcriptional regulator with XRE-family HTH domain
VLALADVADPLGLTSRLIAQYELKGLSMPTAEKLAMMAAVLEVSTSYLVDLSITSELDQAPKDAWIEGKSPSLDKLDADGGGRRSSPGGRLNPRAAGRGCKGDGARPRDRAHTGEGPLGRAFSRVLESLRKLLTPGRGWL